MGEAASEDQEVPGRLRKLSPHSDLNSDHLILSGSRCSPQTEASDVGLQHAPGSWNLAHGYDTS